MIATTDYGVDHKGFKDLVKAMIGDSSGCKCWQCINQVSVCRLAYERLLQLEAAGEPVPWGPAEAGDGFMECPSIDALPIRGGRRSAECNAGENA